MRNRWLHSVLAAPRPRERSAESLRGELFPEYHDDRAARQSSGEVGAEYAEGAIAEDRVLDNGAPAHRAYANRAEDQVAQVEADAQREVRDLTVTAASRTIEADGHDRRAGDHLDDVRAALADRDEAREQRLDYQGRIDGLPASRRPTRFAKSELLLACFALIGGDTLVLTLSLTLTPGTPVQHRATAFFLSSGIAVFTNALGWAAARVWEALPARLKLPLAGCGLAGLVSILGYALWTLQDFRSEALGELLAGAGTVVDPTFFGPFQLLLSAGATLAAFRFWLTDTGRHLRARESVWTAEERVAERLAADARRRSRGEMDAATASRVDAKQSLESIPFVLSEADAKARSVRAHSRFMRWWSDAMFLMRRFSAVEVPPSVELVAENNRYNLLRYGQRYAAVLATLSLGVGVVALVLVHVFMAIVCLAISVLHVLAMVYLRVRLHQRSQEDRDWHALLETGRKTAV